MSNVAETWRKHSSSLTVLLACILIGAAIGLWAPAMVETLTVLSDVYLRLLKMIAMPFMVSAIIFSLSQLMTTGGTSQLLGRVIKLLVYGMLAGAVLGIACAVIVGPGRDLSDDNLLLMGQLVGEDLGGGKAEMALHGPAQVEQSMTAKDLALSLVPSNIFAALTQGEMLKVLVFSLLFGFVMGRLPSKYSNPLNDALRGVFYACVRLTIWFNYLLPPVLIAIVAQQVATSGVGAIKGMLGFLLTLALACLVAVLVSLVVIRWASGSSWQAVLRSQKEALVMAMATRSSPACMPLMIDNMARELGLPLSRLELMVPLGVSLFRVGSVLCFTIATVFIAQMYGKDLAAAEWAIVIVGSVLAGFGAAGMTGLVGLGMIGVICAYIGLPFAALFVLFVAVDTFSDTMRTMVNVAAASALAVLACKPDRAVAP